MVWRIFSWYTLGPLVPIEHCLNTQTTRVLLLTIHPFMTTVYPSSDGYFQQDNAPCHKSSNHVRLVSWHDNEFTLLIMASTVTRSQSNKAPFGMWWNWRFSSWMCSRAAAWCYHVNMDQNLWGIFPTACWIYATRIKAVLKSKGVQPGTSRVYLISCQLVYIC